MPKFKKGQGYWLGKKRSPEDIEKMRKGWRKAFKLKKFTAFYKGHIITNTGRTRFKKGIPNNVGENNPMWKGGRIRGINGYIKIHKPIHPFANKRGYVLEHRLIMEKMLGRYLKIYENVHHKNNIKDDNRPVNLELVITRVHYGKVRCPYCRKKFLIR